MRSNAKWQRYWALALGLFASLTAINSHAQAPVTTNDTVCQGRAATLRASGSIISPDTNYRWFTSPTGGNYLNGVYGPTYTFTPAFTQTLYVALSDNGNYSNRTPVTAVVKPGPKVLSSLSNSQLWAHYPFNNGVGDISGNSNNLLASGQGNANDRNGVGAGAASFNSTSGTASTANSQNLANVSSLSYTVWLQSNDANGGLIVGWGNQPDRNILSTVVDRQLYMTANGDLWFRMGSDSIHAPGTQLNDNRWHLVAVTVGADGFARLYVDGAVRTEDTISSRVDFTGHLRVVNDQLTGAPGQPTSTRLACNLDDLRIYNRALSVNELTAIYQSPAMRIRLAGLTACASVSPTIRLINTQRSAYYQLLEANSLTAVGNAILGRIDSITFPLTTTSSTNYVIRATDTTTNCSVILDTVIRATVLPLPDAPTSPAANQSGCGPTRFTITVRGAQQGSYRWYTTPTGGLPFYTDSTFIAPLAVGDSAVYYVAIAGSNGCLSPRTKVKAMAVRAIATLSGPSYVSTNGLYAYMPLNGSFADNGPASRPVILSNQATVSYTTNRFNTANTAMNFTGGGAIGAVNNQIAWPGPQAFTISTWFRTTSTSGGRLLGYQSSNNASGGSFDRMIYITNSGQLHFGTNGNSRVTVSTTQAYNDGNWHHVTASWSPATGLKLYVNGVLRASNATVTTAQSFAGYWVFGGGSTSSWPSSPSGNGFTGTLDEVRYYNRVLSDDEVINLKDVNGVGIYQLNQQACGAPTVGQLVLRGVQTGVSYQLRIKSTGQLVGSAVTANVDTVALASNLIDSTTIYEIVGTDVATGCQGILDSAVTFFGGAQPTKPVSINVSNCGTGSFTLSVVPSTGLTYRWYRTMTGVVAVSTGTNIQTPIVSAGDSAIYFVAAVNQAGCESERERVVAKSYRLPANLGNRLRSNLLYNWAFTNGSLLEPVRNNNGTANGAISDTTDAQGRAGMAKFINGAQTNNSFISTATSLGNATLVRPNYSISVWFRTQSTTGGALVGYAPSQTGNATNHDRLVYLDDDNRVAFFQRAGNGQTPATALVRSANKYNDNRWHHVVATFNTAEGMRLYVDGALAGTATNISTSQGNTGFWRMGYNALTNVPNRPSTDAYTGAIDNVRIYNRALTEQDILALGFDPQLTLTATGLNACGTGNVQIKVRNTQPGFSYQVTSNNQPVGAAQVATTDSVIFDVNGLTRDTTLRVSVTDPASGCTINLDTTLNARVFPTPSAPAVNDTVRCGSGAAIMRATGGSAGNYRWYTSATGGTSVANTPTLSVTITLGTGVILDSAIRYVSIVGPGGCEGPRQMIRARAAAAPTAAPTVAAPATGMCLGDSLLLTATGPYNTYVWRNGATVVGTTSGSIWVKASGTFTASGLNDLGCSSPASTGYNVLASAKPAQPVITLQTAGTLRLTVTAVSNATFTWFLNGVQVTGQTTNTLLNPTVGGTYRVVVNLRGCVSDTSDPFVVVSLATKASGATLNVWPNPASTSLQIEAGMLNDDVATVSLTDVAGRIYESQPMLVSAGNGKMTMSVDQLPAGVYYVRIETRQSGQVLMSRIVIRK